MKRRNFIKHFSLTSIALVVFPSWILKSESKKQLIAFPALNLYTRHGGLEQKKHTFFTGHKTKIISRQVLYKNGLSKSPDDLNITQLLFKGQLIVVQHAVSGTSISINNEYKNLSLGETFLNTFSISLIKGTVIHSNSTSDSVLVLPLTHFLIDDKKHLKKTAILTQGINAHEIEAPYSDSFTLLIS